MKKNIWSILLVYAVLFAAILSILLSSCKKDTTITANPFIPSNGPDIIFYGLTNDNKINQYNANASATVISSLTITGLATDEKILSIDFRPATGQLYGIGSTSRLYVINLKDGVAKALGTASFTPAINGTVVNIDFNPTVDRIRLVTGSGQNLRLHPELGTVAATDLAINGAANASVTSVAYTNSKAGATTTELFDIDITTKKLYKQIPPNDGLLVEVGALGVDFTGRGGFDISAANNTALATFTVADKHRLYSINLSTGAATYINDFATTLLDIAIVPASVAFGVDESNNLIIFDPSNPQTTISKSITGLAVNEKIQGIDFRPANGQLYAFAVNSGAAKLYTINTASGAAVAVGTGFAVNTLATSYGFDFNPTVDRIRLVSNLGENLRLNPNDGSIAATDLSLNPGSPSVSSAAYTNNFNGATTTVLFVADASKLYRQDPPNNGTLIEIGSLGRTVDALGGFDIGGNSGVAYAVFTVGTTNTLYTVNTTTGATTTVGNISVKLRGFAVGLGM